MLLVLLILLGSGCAAITPSADTSLLFHPIVLDDKLWLEKMPDGRYRIPDELIEQIANYNDTLASICGKNKI